MRGARPGTPAWSKRGAPDGVIEAFRVAGASSFAVALQWHPEWQVIGNPFSSALFAEFGAACRARADQHRT